MFAIMGASGNIGSKIARNLLDKGEGVRVLGRSIEKLKSFIERGAEALIGDAFVSPFLTDAFRGSKAVYVMIPRDNAVDNLRACDNKIGESIASAIQDNNAGKPMKRLFVADALGRRPTSSEFKYLLSSSQKLRLKK